MNQINYKSQTNSKIGKTWTLETMVCADKQLFLSEDSEDTVNHSTSETNSFSDYNKHDQTIL